MAKEHLTAKGWKAISKEHKWPDDKLLAALEAYEDVADGEDYAEQVKTLEKIGEQVYAAGKKKDLPKEVEKYLGQIEKESKGPLAGAKEGVRLAASMSRQRGPAKEDEGDEDEGEEEGDGTLEGTLKIIKTRGDNLEKAMSFIACVGKPYALALAKRLGTKHKKAVKAKAGGSKFFEGKCIFEANAYTFLLEAAPPRGLAKQLKASMYTDCGKNHKVRVRDFAGTAVLDDEADELPAEDQPVQGTSAGTETKPVTGAKVSEAKGKFEAPADLEKLAKRLPTLSKTVVYALKQAPDESVRILSDVESELNQAIAKIQAKDRTLAIPPLAEELKKKIAAGKATVIANLNSLAQTHALEWVTELKPLIDEGAAPKPKALIDAITKIEKGMVLDKALVARLKQAPSPLYAKIESGLVKARAKYEASFPRRTKESDPIDPPKANRPAVGKLGDDFKQIVDRSEAAMANDNKPSVEDLRAMVAQIDTQLPKDLKGELKKTYKTWDGVKDHYKELLKTDKKVANEFMSNYWWFRRRVVDDLMAELQSKYDFKWASVGSANLESDYDISIKSHGKLRDKTIYDWQIVNEFNKKISTEYGCQPGTLFDTNLYASAVVEAPQDDGPDTPEKRETKKNMQAMAESGQDVGALMKMRRYMDWEDFEKYKEGILGDITKDIKEAGNRETQKVLMTRLQAAQRQFEEADDLYFMAIFKQLEKAGLKPPRDLSPEGQKQLLSMAARLEHEGDKLMETNNDLYVEAMEDVRKIEEELKSTAPTDTEKRNALFAKLKTAQADATFFAAEAYHSEGPFKHIVEARQSSDAKVKNDDKLSKLSESEKKQKVDELTAKAIEAMSVTQMMQSFNENLGDLLKDLRHYADKSDLPALGFFRSSKYFERLCDAMDIIGKKLGPVPAVQREFQAIRVAGKTPADMRTALGKLVKVRGGAGFKSKADFPNDPEAVEDPEKEKEAFVIAEMAKAMPAVKTLKDLASAVTTAGGQVNSVLRKAAAAGDAMIAGDERAYFQ